MRRSCASFGLIVLVAACGLDVVGRGPSARPDGEADAAPLADGGGGPSSQQQAEGGATDADAAASPLVPSHTAEAIDLAAADLSGVTAIDTSALTITGASSKPRFEDHGGIAILYVAGWTVDQPVRVSGTRKLIVLAAGAVKIDALLDAGARGAAPGPGGFAAGAGAGAGGNGEHKNADDSSGGGGGGFGGAGAAGGDVSDAVGGAGGAVYGGALSDFFGGAGGGKGGDACTTDTGGAGGGAVQITSRISITIAGGINVGGGGGSGGCSYSASAESAAGGGGGSGGMIFLEAPQVTVSGSLAANGGGGGTGSYYNGGVDGVAGADATGVGVAAGGSKSQTSPGGAGATGTSAPVKPTNDVANNGGGGGGGVGRIWLRTRSTPAVLQPVAKASPTPTLDTAL